MISFPDATIADRFGLNLNVHTNPEGLADGVSPGTHCSAIHTDIMKAQSRLQADRDDPRTLVQMLL